MNFLLHCHFMATYLHLQNCDPHLFGHPCQSCVHRRIHSNSRSYIYLNINQSTIIDNSSNATCVACCCIQMGDDWTKFIAGLRYGNVVVNAPAAMGFGVTCLRWGAVPGETKFSASSFRTYTSSTAVDTMKSIIVSLICAPLIQLIA